ncbi:ChuX/HutX family heme-like substrate-binding protein [Craterilacuibacter sp. RT1T]|uniref:hemin-degrading factor n=1 Tax=Craterilacuibacter sp. RT1T TaxID=2942211 RepID=UPI0020BFDF53|nr:ChuX/HutX family heme-like substrate-binding protein [Craterilacuibacter sp. RT1T]MCL6262366.1 hemin-degrading factor [Craterilacuibacter sp. RT1T]
MEITPQDLMTQLTQLRAQEGVLYPRDTAAQLGITECELVHADPAATRLDTSDWPALLSAIAALGEVTALAHNSACVHELTGHYGNVTFDGKVGLAINPVIDLRFFLFGWAHAYAQVTAGTAGIRRSLQFFDRSGRVIQKVLLNEGSDVAAFDALRERFACPRAALQLDAASVVQHKPASSDIDIPAFQRDWLALGDVHAFHPLLRRYGLSRQQAFRLAPPGQAWQVRTDAVEMLLRRAVAIALPIMVFAGNGGIIQIHTGPIHEVKLVGNWLNVLDAHFKLHLRTDLISEAWVTHKPGDTGAVTSLELFNEAGESLVTFFGERKPGQSERIEWRKLLGELLPLENDDA